MDSILNRVQQDQERFVPTTIEQYIGLQIARKLQDLSRLEFYVQQVRGSLASAIANAVRDRRYHL